MKKKKQDLSRLFHYTVGTRLESIFRDKFLKIASACVVFNEKGAVWLTYSQDWENTANKSMIVIDKNGNRETKFQNKEETEASCNGLFRIEIKPDKYRKNDWKDYKKRSGIYCKLATALYNVAVSGGSQIGLWRYSFDPIPIEEWLCLEKWDGNKWVELDFEEYLNRKKSKRLITLFKGFLRKNEEVAA
jgi:hypothetical protein